MFFALLTLSPMVQGQDTSQQDRLRDVLGGILPEEVDDSLLGTNPHVNPDFPNEEITKDGLVFYVEGEAPPAPIVTEACKAAIAQVGDNASDEAFQTLIESCDAEHDDQDERRRGQNGAPDYITCYTHSGFYVGDCGFTCDRSNGYFKTGYQWPGWCCKGSIWRSACGYSRHKCNRITIFQHDYPVQVVVADCKGWFAENIKKYPSIGGDALGKICINNRMNYMLVNTSGVQSWSKTGEYCKARF